MRPAPSPPQPTMDPAPPTKLSFSFKAKPKAKAATAVPLQSSAFASLDDEPLEEEVSSSKPGRPGFTKPKSLVPTQVTMTKAMKREMEAQKRVDATVYQYDEVYDRLKEADRLAEIAREEEAKIRQVHCRLLCLFQGLLMTTFYPAQIYWQSVTSRRLAQKGPSYCRGEADSTRT